MTYLENLLGPGILKLTPENPALHILGFHHEDSVTGNYDVVDLCAAIIGGQGDVMQYGVLLFGEEEFEEEGDLEFAEFAFEPGGL